MSLHPLRTTRLVTGSVLVATTMMTGLCFQAAQAQELAFAQKRLGGTHNTAEAIQFRSTIIDPARPDKAANPDMRNLRLIPMGNTIEVGPGKHNCTICGVVESISLMVRDGGLNNKQEPDGESAIEDMDKSQGKLRSNLLLTSERWQIAPLPTTAKKLPPVYEVKVRMSDGSVRIVHQPTQPEYAVGDYVRVITGAVTAA